MTVAVYTIARNEAAHIERWADSARDADIRLVLDTGSTDGTPQLAADAGCIVHPATIDPWRFDTARNLALDLIPLDARWCITLDADEILAPGWRDALEAVPADATRVRYRYIWSWQDDGTPGVEFTADRIHRRHGYRWQYPCHEHLTAAGPEMYADAPGMEIHHHPDHTKPRSTYLPLLELGAREHPDSDRMAFYYGRELYYHGRWAEARAELWRYLHLPTAGWGPERSHALRMIAAMDTHPEPWLLRACAEAPDRREPWAALAEHYAACGMTRQAAAAADRALSITTKPLDYLCEPEAWGDRPHQLVKEAA